ncbi:MAG: penicillin-binding protein [Bacteroidota bacterium]
MATNVRKVIMVRTYTAYAFMCVFAIAILFYLFKIQFKEGKKWTKLADSLSTTIQTVEPSRGNIFACDYSLLATSLPIYDLRIDGASPGFSDDEIFDENIDSLALLLSKEFDDGRSKSDYKRLLSNIKKHEDRYYLLKRKVSYTQMKRVVKFPIFRMGKYKGGLNIEEKDRREKPFDYLAERTIGYSVNGIAPVGIEGAYDKELTGKPGKRVMQRIAGGTWIPINDEEQIDAQNGKDIVTTIDVNVQDVAEQALMNTLIKNDAQWGTAILMEVKTGEIKAIANLTRVSEGIYNEQYNYAVGESLEPGSTFKLTSLLALLDDGKAKLTDTYNTEGGKKQYFANATMYDSEAGGHGIINLQQAFELSSNVAISSAVYQAYQDSPSEFVEHLKKLKLNKPIGLQITGEGNPRIKERKDKDWYGTTLPWSSIGYEIKVTPMQMLTLYNAVANNGKMVKPIFVNQISQTGKIIKEFKTEVMVEQICKPSTLKQLRSCMEGVVQHGTATNLKNPNYTVAGKTGTALVADGRSGYKIKVYRASFVGYFPADNPQYTCMVMVNGPSKGIYYGSAVAGPVFKEIADKVYASNTSLHSDLTFTVNSEEIEIPTAHSGNANDLKTVYNKFGISSHEKNDSADDNSSEWSTVEINKKYVTLFQQKSKKEIVPDVKGMGLKDAVYILENSGLKVFVEGVGKVKEQSLTPGQKCIKGMSISLKLS